MAAPAVRIGALPGLTEANRRWWTLAGTVFQAVLDDDLHAGQVEPSAFASVCRTRCGCSPPCAQSAQP